MPLVLAEVSDKIPGPLAILFFGLSLAAATFFICRLTKWVAYAALLAAAYLPLFVLEFVRDDEELRDGILAEQGVAYLLLAVLSSSLPFLAAVTAALGHRQRSLPPVSG